MFLWLLPSELPSSQKQGGHLNALWKSQISGLGRASSEGWKWDP